ncbi:hypothetical protein [Parapedobacter lycopersici]|uniref:hypothetical protein n=1 Tax=Parapedobacter lycopersici TaxID=1864939 RepID=UPI003340C73E
MLIGSLDTQKRLLILEYPKRARLPKQKLPITSQQHAISLWKSKARQYIYDTLHKYTLQRQHACQYNLGTDYAKKMNAVDKLLFMLVHNYQGSLLGLCAKVVADRGHIEQLAPRPRSRYWQHYQEVILPIVEWCTKHVREMSGTQQHN